MESVKQEDFQNKRPNLNPILWWILYFLAIPIIRIEVSQLLILKIIFSVVACGLLHLMLCFDKPKQIQYPRSFTKLWLSSFPCWCPLAAQPLAGRCSQPWPCRRGRLLEKGADSAHRLPFTEFPAGSTDCSHRAGFSMLKELYLSPEIKLKAKAGLRPPIVSPYSRLRNKFCGVLDFRKNLKCCFEGHKRMSLSAWKQMLLYFIVLLINTEI